MLHCPTLHLLWVIGACQSAYSCHDKKKSVARNNFKTPFRFLPESQKVAVCRLQERWVVAVSHLREFARSHLICLFTDYPGPSFLHIQALSAYLSINGFWFGLLPLRPVYFCFAHKIEFVRFSMSVFHWGRKHFENKLARDAVLLIEFEISSWH